ncbi:hypothetical protein DERP_007861 [Dermatophagoides pteronyssinus]|uniref:Uncharacterized protein n=1 Tax=Dermatophagoides pteronyssinus TaxID=6956 RepID=A0ABQ8ITI9_DERPT|nr:hypothetical protein DERP_007861 [Dermatophagoides pteronyssinus]
MKHLKQPQQQPSNQSISYEIRINRKKVTPFPTTTTTTVVKNSRSPMDRTETTLTTLNNNANNNRDANRIPRMCDRFERVIGKNRQKFQQNIQCWTMDYHRINHDEIEQLLDNYRKISEKINQLKHCNRNVDVISAI